MAEYVINDTTLTAIGDSIRRKTGGDNLMSPSEMPGQIDSIVGDIGDYNLLYSSYKSFLDGTAVSPILPNDLTEICDYGFYGRNKMTLDALPSGITEIGSYAFCSCSSLALTSLPEGLTSITPYSFRDCSALALTHLPSGIKSIGIRAFSNCGKMVIKSFPSTLESISNNAFTACNGLTEITFNSQPTIASTAFLSCTNLTQINVPWAEGAVAGAPWGATNATITYNYTGGTE